MHSLLIRFIDLGLLLLMAFLATAELMPVVQSPLPHGTETEAPGSAYRILFDAGHATVRHEPTDTLLCQPNSFENLARCLRTLGRSAGPFLLSPVGQATVQNLVEVMDICLLQKHTCSIAP